MICSSTCYRAESPIVFREAWYCTPMMAADRSTRSCCAILFLFVLLGLPAGASSATLEDSAKELARKIAAALPAQESVSCEIRNLSSLQPGEVARIEQALETELQGKGISLKSNGGTVDVMVTLSENFANLVWTAEIRQGGASQVVLLAVERSAENRAFPAAMPVTIRGEKFWEGPERVLDAGEVSDGVAKSWQVLLLPDGVRIRDMQDGSVSTLEIAPNQSANRDPWGNLDVGQMGNTIALILAPSACIVNLSTRSLEGCLPADGSAGGAVPSHFPVMFDVTPPGPPPPEKGTVIKMQSVCGGAGQFLATGARDYTQTDSVQVFQAEASGPVAVSAEFDFPGPITALHAASATPRAVVRNLSTGNYEAYRLSFSCGQ